MNRRGRSQMRKNKETFDNFSDETYIRLKPEAKKLAIKYKDEKFTNIFNEACEKLALDQEQVVHLTIEKNTLMQECKSIENDNNDLNRKIRQLDTRINNLLGEYNEQRSKTDGELHDKDIKIVSMGKLLKEMKIRESENHDYMEKLEKERNDLKSSNNNQKESIKNLKLEIEDHCEQIGSLLQERNELKFTISALENTVEMMKRDQIIDETLIEDSIIEMDNTITHHSMLEFTKSFSITHNNNNNERTIQQELDDKGYHIGYSTGKENTKNQRKPNTLNKNNDRNLNLNKAKSYTEKANQGQNDSVYAIQIKVLELEEEVKRISTRMVTMEHDIIKKVKNVHDDVGPANCSAVSMASSSEDTVLIGDETRNSSTTSNNYLSNTKQVLKTKAPAPKKLVALKKNPSSNSLTVNNKGALFLIGDSLTRHMKTHLLKGECNKDINVFTKFGPGFPYDKYTYPTYHTNFVPVHTLSPPQTLPYAYTYPSLGTPHDISPSTYHYQPHLDNHCHASFVTHRPNFQVFPTSLLV
ncbi:hypothetical protein WDU94_003698 [Cyamophila willieti]